MANPIIPGIPQTEQDLLYSKLNAYNQGRASYKEVGAYLIVLPRPEYLQYTLWIYSPLPGRQSIFYICDLSTDIHETLRMASTLCFYSPRSLLLVEYNAKRMQSKGTTPYFYVRQVLKLKDSIGNFVSIRLNARTASRKSCQLPAVEHAYQMGEVMKIASARIARTYIIGSTKYTRLTHVKLHVPTG